MAKAEAFVISGDMREGKNPGWWKEAKEAREEKVRVLVRTWYGGFNQKEDVHSYVEARLTEAELLLCGTDNELNTLINKELYQCIGLM